MARRRSLGKVSMETVNMVPTELQSLGYTFAVVCSNRYVYITTTCPCSIQRFFIFYFFYSSDIIIRFILWVNTSIHVNYVRNVSKIIKTRLLYRFKIVSTTFWHTKCIVLYILQNHRIVLHPKDY